MKENKVVIVGAGNVGLSLAYALVNQKTSVNSLYIIDINEKKLKGEVMDLNHTLVFSPSKLNIYAGTYKDCNDADIVVLCAGANQRPGETRLDLVNKNTKLFKEILDNILKTNFNGIFLVATNPVDVLSYYTYRYTKFSKTKVIGSGTSLDTARLRYLIGKKAKVNPKSVHAYVLGEHGDSEFIPWKSADIGLQNINNFLSKEDMLKIDEKVKNAAYEIINLKGHTSYGIGVCLSKIINAILDDERSIYVLSTYDKKNNVYIGLPVILGREGIIKKIYFNLDKSDTKKLQKSINIIKDVIKSIDD